MFRYSVFQVCCRACGCTGEDRCKEVLGYVMLGYVRVCTQIRTNIKSIKQTTIVLLRHRKGLNLNIMHNTENCSLDQGILENVQRFTSGFNGVHVK